MFKVERLPSKFKTTGYILWWSVFGSKIREKIYIPNIEHNNVGSYPSLIMWPSIGQCYCIAASIIVWGDGDAWWTGSKRFKKRRSLKHENRATLLENKSRFWSIAGSAGRLKPLMRTWEDVSFCRAYSRRYRMSCMPLAISPPKLKGFGWFSNLPAMLSYLFLDEVSFAPAG